MNRMVMICSFYAVGLILGPLDQGRNNGEIFRMRINDIQILNIIVTKRRQMIRMNMRT
jgi:hypothetical protein